MLDIIIFCAIALFLGYKLYTSFGKYNQEDVEVATKQGEKKADIISVNEKPALEVSKKNDISFEKQKQINNEIEEIKKQNDLIFKDVDQNSIDYFTQFNKKYPTFGFATVVKYASDFFEKFFSCHTLSNFDEVKSLIDGNLIKKLSDQQSVVNQKDFLYKIDSVKLQSFTYQSNFVSVSFVLSCLKISFKIDENANIVSGSKKLPIKFTNTLTFTKTIKEKDDNIFTNWLLSDVA